jgi:hypothetical protein
VEDSGRSEELSPLPVFCPVPGSGDGVGELGKMTSDSGVAAKSVSKSIERFKFLGDTLLMKRDPSEGALFGVKSICAAMGCSPAAAELWAERVQKAPHMHAQAIEVISPKGRTTGVGIPARRVPLFVGFVAFELLSSPTSSNKPQILKRMDQYCDRIGDAINEELFPKQKLDPSLRGKNLLEHVYQAAAEGVRSETRGLYEAAERGAKKGARELLLEAGWKLYPRQGITAETKNVLILTVQKFYKGMCPCGFCETLLMKGGKPILLGGVEVGEVDHWYHRARNELDGLWLLHAKCHERRGDNHSSKWAHAFYSFQDRVKDVTGHRELF